MFVCLRRTHTFAGDQFRDSAQVDADMQELLSSLPQAIGTKVHEGDACFPTLERLGVLQSVTPVHAWDVGRKLDPAMISRFPDTDTIRNYYGEAVALYFAWMNFMWRWLCLPAVLGLVVFGLNSYWGAGKLPCCCACAAARIGTCK